MLRFCGAKVSKQAWQLKEVWSSNSACLRDVFESLIALRISPDLSADQGRLTLIYFWHVRVQSHWGFAKQKSRSAAVRIVSSIQYFYFMMYVYILKCSDESYYTGVTNDIDRRIKEHESGKNSTSYTSSKLPVELVFVERVKDPNQAIAFEKQIKGWSRRKKEALINGDFDLLVGLSKRGSRSH